MSSIPSFHFILIALIPFLAVNCVAAAKWQPASTHYTRFGGNRGNGYYNRHRPKPNIVFILTDDQDLLLGSMKHMPKTLKLLRDEGVTFDNSFVTTPMCCPSRSTILTGMYPHNHNVYSNNDNCSSPMWQREHEPHVFSNYLANEGYRTGYFGKYLNEYNGSYIPPGWSEWVGLVKNSRFYNYTLNFNGEKIRHYDNYYKDYLTDLIANDSVTFLKKSKQYFSNRPVLMVLSVPAPHGPEDSAPQFQKMFYNNTDHRTPSWDIAPNLDKQWLLRYTFPMEPIHQLFTDILQQKRLQTLQSVDDLVEKVTRELDMLGELDNTYIIFTSDHGYHLGQFGLVKGKAMPYDFDTRVPLYMRGPGIKPGMSVSNIVSNVDLAPTILDMAGVHIPDRMDGLSMLTLLKAARHPTNVDSKGFVATKRAWRDTVLLERGKLTQKKWKRLIKMENEQLTNDLNPDALPYLHSRQRRIVKICSKAENHPPCKLGQKFVCTKDGGRTRLQKCTSKKYLNSLVQGDQAPPPKKSACSCPKSNHRKIHAEEKRKQRHFLQMHVNRDFHPKFLRNKRSVLRRKRTLPFTINEAKSKMFEPQSSLLDVIDSDNDDGIDIKLNNNLPPQTAGVPFSERRCRILPNNTILCDHQLYVDEDAWKDHKVRIDEMIKEYRKVLDDLRVIRKHLKERKPTEDFNFSNFDEEEEDCNCEDSNITVRKDITENEYEEPEIDFSKFSRKRRKKLKKKWKKKNKRRKNFTKECNAPFMKCFVHDNDHWKTQPLWNSRKFRPRKDLDCQAEGQECTVMYNGHWKTPPLWTNGSFCFCPNSNNNTYWCLRTINQTHDFLYCEFVTNFISFYDLNKDPFQLNNTVTDLNYGILQQLHDQLAELRSCQGASECTVSAPEYFKQQRKRRSKRGRKWRKQIRRWRREKRLQKRS